MNRLRTPLVTLSTFAAALLVLPAAASASTTLWQIGTPSATNATPAQGSAEFMQTREVKYSASTSFEIGVDSDTDLPEKLSDASHCSTACTGEIVISFDVDQADAHDDLRLSYRRFGAEVDELYFDGTYLGRVASTETGLAEFVFSLGDVDAGAHTITITYVGDDGDGKHDIDAISLINHTAASGTPMWRLGTVQGATASASAASAEFGWTNSQWTSDMSYDVDDAGHDADAPEFPRGLSDATRAAKNRPGAVAIDFNLATNYGLGDLIFDYGRYGAETNEIYYDGNMIGQIAGNETLWMCARFALPAKVAGDYQVEIAIVDDLLGDGIHAFDYLRMFES